jgi:hypothetical protein
MLGTVPLSDMFRPAPHVRLIQCVKKGVDVWMHQQVSAKRDALQDASSQPIHLDPQAISLLTEIFVFEPHKRISALTVSVFLPC